MGKKIRELGTDFDWSVFQVQLYLLDNELFDNTNSIYEQFPFKYGEKTISPYFARMLKTYKDLGLPVENVIAYDMYQLYGESWKRIKTALFAEYNPIENYDRNEHSETTHTGTDTDKYGAQTNTVGQQTNTYGERSDTKGEQVDTIGEADVTYGRVETTYGGKHITDGARTDTNQHDVSAFNQNTYSPESKDTHIIGAQEHTESLRIDSVDEHTDVNGEHTNTSGERVDTKGQQIDTISSRSDTVGQKTDEHEKDTKDETESRIHGNVGVTTNQQMIESELSLRQRFKFLDILLTDISHELCLRVYSL